MRDFFAPVAGADTLLIDDLSAAPTTVHVDLAGTGTPATLYAATDYLLMPLNAADGPEPRPYTSLFLPAWTAQEHAWPRNTLVRITGRFGWPAVPVAIIRATCHLTGILRLETPRAQATINEMGQIVQASSQARLIVERLKDQYSRKRVLV